jgi:kynurenine formamidase
MSHREHRLGETANTAGLMPPRAADTVEHFKTVGARLRNWERWGKDDQRGTLNFITADRLAAAARLIRKGRTFSLALPLGAGATAHGESRRRRPAPVHLMSLLPGDLQLRDGVAFADDVMIMPLQSGTQWDALAHCLYDGQMYNGYSAACITASDGAARLGIERIGAGVAGRGVLLDIARLRGADCLAPGLAVTPEELEEAERRQGVRASTGDILLVRTGWPRRFEAAAQTGWPLESTVDVRGGGIPLAPEAGLSLACCEWLHDREIAAVASDNYAIEVIPAEDARSILPLHCVLIRDMGMTLGECFDLEELARDCVTDGVWEFFLTAPPLKIRHGAGSPINPLAIK